MSLRSRLLLSLTKRDPRVRVLHLSTSDMNGGAARAAYRLHIGLQKIGVDSTMLVLDKASDDRSVEAYRRTAGKLWAMGCHKLDSLPLRLYGRAEYVWSVGWLPNDVPRRVRSLNPDVINLHWICHGFVSSRTLGRLERPLIWRMADLWPFTGGCHYPGICRKYVDSCGACPQLSSHRTKDLSRWVWRKKNRHYRGLDLTFVATSRWLFECAKASSLLRNFPVEHIPNGLDLTAFKPVERHQAREIIGSPHGKKIVLTGAINPLGDIRKGFSHIQDVCAHLVASGWADKVELTVFGASEPLHAPQVGIKIRYLGHLRDDWSLALAYSSADVFLALSREESFGQTLVEAGACGTPSVAFGIGGHLDSISHKETGYLARPFEVEDLAAGISWVLEDEDRQRALSRAARRRVENHFGIEKIARRYLTLYEDVLSSRRRRSNSTAL